MTLALLTKKHPQHILAVRAESFSRNENFKENVTSYSAMDWITDVRNNGDLIIGERDMLETNSNYRQILPYVIVYKKDASGIKHYMPYRRTSKVGEQRLAGNVSIGYGGHLDLADIRVTGFANDASIIDLFNTIHGAVAREIKEELQFFDEKGFPLLTTSFVPQFKDLFILDDTNNVGKVHVGLVLELSLPSSVTVSTGEDELKSMPSMVIQELLFSDLPLENWTRLFLQYEFAKTGTPLEVQSYLSYRLKVLLSSLEDSSENTLSQRFAQRCEYECIARELALFNTRFESIGDQEPELKIEEIQRNGVNSKEVVFTNGERGFFATIPFGSNTILSKEFMDGTVSKKVYSR